MEIRRKIPRRLQKLKCTQIRVEVVFRWSGLTVAVIVAVVVVSVVVGVAVVIGVAVVVGVAGSNDMFEDR